MADDAAYAVGIDLGGSSVKAVRTTMGGSLLAEVNRPFDADGDMDWGRTIKAVLAELDQEGGERVALGVAAPGLVERTGFAIAFMPGRLQGLEKLIWTDFLQSPHPVHVINDAHGALLGESWVGAARGFSNVIMLTLGTGVGGAAIVDGRLLQGEIGRAGHLGHSTLDTEGPLDVTGIPGSLEMAIGNCTIEMRSSHESTHALIEAVGKGDEEARVVWNTSVKRLACAICSFINILDPAAVIIGGGIARSGAALFVPLQEWVDAFEWRPGGHKAQILPATLGEYAGAYGAAYNALQKSGKL